MSSHSFGRGGEPDGTLMVSVGKWYGDDVVELDLGQSTFANLTPEQARAIAADLVTHADYVDGSSR